MFDGTVYFYVFINNELEFSCYSAFFSENIKRYSNIELEFVDCKVMGIDNNNGDLEIKIFLKSAE